MRQKPPRKLRTRPLKQSDETEKLTFVLETNLLVISIVLSARNLTGTLVVVLEPRGLDTFLSAVCVKLMLTLAHWAYSAGAERRIRAPRSGGSRIKEGKNVR